MLVRKVSNQVFTHEREKDASVVRSACERVENMIKYPGIGLFVMIAALIIGFTTEDWNTALIIIAVAALLPLLAAGLLSGAFISGDRNRANYHMESKSERHRKSGWAGKLVLLSAPNAVLLLVMVIIGLTR